MGGAQPGAGPQSAAAHGEASGEALRRCQAPFNKATKAIAHGAKLRCYCFFFVPHLKNVTRKWREINLALIPSYLVTSEEGFSPLSSSPPADEASRSEPFKVAEKVKGEGKCLPRFIDSASQLCSGGGFTSQQQFLFFFFPHLC